MKYSLISTNFILVCLGIGLSACGSQNIFLPTPTQTEEPMLITQAGPASLDLNVPNAFQMIPGDYSIRLDFSFVGSEADGSPVAGQVLINGLHQAQPPGTDLRYMANGDAALEGLTAMQVVELGGQDYFVNDKVGCLTKPSSDEKSPFTKIVDPATFLSGRVLRMASDAEVNGVPSYAFAITEENLDVGVNATMDVNSLEGTLYLAQDGGYLTRLVLEGAGASEMLSGSGELEGDISYQLDFTPMESPVSVNVPDSCSSDETGEAPIGGDYPVMANATNLASFAGFLSYQTGSGLASVVDFYQTEMAALGWTLDNELTVGGTTVLNFTMGATTIGIVISQDPNNGMVSVILAEE